MLTSQLLPMSVECFICIGIQVLKISAYLYDVFIFVLKSLKQCGRERGKISRYWLLALYDRAAINVITQSPISGETSYGITTNVFLRGKISPIQHQWLPLLSEVTMLATAKCKCENSVYTSEQYKQIYILPFGSVLQLISWYLEC